MANESNALPGTSREQIEGVGTTMVLAVLRGAVNKILTSALVDPHGTVAGKQNTVDPTA